MIRSDIIRLHLHSSQNKIFILAVTIWGVFILTYQYKHRTMNNFIQNLKCSLTNKQTLNSYYANLSHDQLIDKKKNLWKTYVALMSAWILSFGLIIISTDLRMPLFIMLMITIGSTIISLIADYNHRKSLIDKEINKFI